MLPGITQAKAYMPDDRSNTGVVGSEILACSGGYRTDEHVIAGSGGENRLGRGHDPVMVREVRLRTGSGHFRTVDTAARIVDNPSASAPALLCDA